MRLILLGGNGYVNKMWIEDVEKKIASLFDSTVVLNYDHWQNNQPMIDLDKEKEKLTKIIGDSKDTVIFAKSAGILVTLKAVCEDKIKPVKLIFVGVPLKWAKDNGFGMQKWIKKLSTSTLIIQNENDPFCSLENLNEFLLKNEVNSVEVRQLPGDTHDYKDIDGLYNLISNFIK